jgi:proteasome lid subunit RPN8/RPN11
MLVTCALNHVESTLGFLSTAGHRHIECIVLWLGKRNGDQVHVEEAYLPDQVAEEDMFLIPPASMTKLYAHLRAKRLMVAAQVHSHPREAFHSLADDRWAIIRHEGALSLVVPYFASQTSVANFLDQTKVFQFTSSRTWDEVELGDMDSWLKLS